MSDTTGKRAPITYADWARTRDPDGTIAAIVEILESRNPLIERPRARWHVRLWRWCSHPFRRTRTVQKGRARGSGS